MFAVPPASLTFGFFASGIVLLATGHDPLSSYRQIFDAAYVLTYLIFNTESYWRETKGFNATVFPTGKQLPDSALWPGAVIHAQGGIVLPLGAGIAVLVAVLLWFLYTRTRFGFEAQV